MVMGADMITIEGAVENTVETATGVIAADAICLGVAAGKIRHSQWLDSEERWACGAWIRDA